MMSEGRGGEVTVSTNSALVALISVHPSEPSALLISEVFCDSLTLFLLDF